MKQNKKILLIIDGNALIHRSFYALPPTLRTKDGVLVNAVYGFTSFLLKSLQEFKPTYIVLTLDKKGPTFRHKEYKEYKANRVKAADELYEQIPIVKKVVKSFNIPIFEKTSYEADDLIGTICEQTKDKKNIEKIIVTGDMDTLQLVNKETKVYTMSRGLSDSVLYDSEKVKEKYQLSPSQIIDYKALRGDPSDNIPGVKGIGQKTATELLNKYDNLENIYKNIKQNTEIKERIKQLLLNHKKEAFLSKKLATIDKNAPINFSLETAKISHLPINEITKVFSELNFKSLINKLHQLDETKANTKKIETKYKLIEIEKEFKLFLKTLKTKKHFTLQAFSTQNEMFSPLLGIAFSWAKHESYFIPHKNKYLEQLKDILEDKQIKKYGHHLKLTWKILAQNNIYLQGLSFDTMIAAYLLSPNNRNHNLNYLVFSELHQEMIEKKDKKSSQLSLLSSPLSATELYQEACQKVDYINQLVPILLKQLQENKMEELFNNIEIPLIYILGEMENNGIKFDAKPINKLNKEITKKLDILTNKIHGLAKTEFNINSPKQLREILFDKLNISSKGIKKTKTGFSTAEDELNKLINAHPIITLIQEHRELSKLQNTYLNALPEIVNSKTGRIHSHFNQTITATGRLSSTEPNLQNIPARTKEGKIIRSSFIANTNNKLISFDYSQIELRLAAHLSNDKKMIQAFLNKADIHSLTAAEINRVSLEQVTPAMRHEAKAINFGILYGQGPHGLSQSAKIPFWRAKQFIDQYFSIYPGIKKMIDKSIADAKKKGYAITMFKRRRPLPDINSNIAMIQKSAERMAINTPVQGSAADLIKLAMIEVQKLIDNNKEEIKLLLQVHDELIFEIKEDKIDYYAKKIKEIMENIITLKIPIIVDQHQGYNWGELK